MKVTVPDDTRTKYEEMRESIKTQLQFVKEESKKDLEIDDIDLDKTLLSIPKMHGKWLSIYSDEVHNLKQLYSMKEKIKLERWKYYSGKQPDSYNAANGIIHEKILKTDIDKYMSADPKLELVDSCIMYQKSITDMIEKVMKELGNMGFHIKSIIEWRKFINGA